MVNRQFVLARRPTGMPVDADFHLLESPVPTPAPGEVLLRAHYLSVDPYMRGRMNAAKSYAPPVEIGGLMVGAGVAEVIESKNPDFPIGDIVANPLMGWQEYAISSGLGLRKVDPAVAPISTALGVLGMTGLTAHIGIHDVCAVEPGQTVVVSGAAGAVGSIAGQVAKIAGCRVVGIAGGRRKCDYVVEELGFDACVDYKAGKLHEDLRAACPKGIDVDFENVGGEILDTVLRSMNPFSRIVVCGLIAEYDAKEPYGYKMLRSVLVNRIRMQGMIVFDWKDRYGEALADLGARVAAGKLRYKESVVEGLDNAPAGFMALLTGGNFGKQLVKLG